MFANRIRVVALADNGTGVKKRTVEGYLHYVAQIFPSVGVKGLHLDGLGKINFRLSSQLRAYARANL